LGNSGMPHSDIRVGPVVASTIYLFDPSMPGQGSGKDELSLTQLPDAPPRFNRDAQETAPTSTSRFELSELTRRLIP